MKSKKSQLCVRTPKVGDIYVDIFSVCDNLPTLSHMMLVGHPDDVKPHLIGKLIKDYDTVEKFVNFFDTQIKSFGGSYLNLFQSETEISEIIQYESESGTKYAIARHTFHRIITDVTSEKISYTLLNNHNGKISDRKVKSIKEYMEYDMLLCIDDVQKSFTKEEIFLVWADWIKQNFDEIKKDPNHIIFKLFLND